MPTQLEKKARKILGITENAGEKEARLAYRRLAKSYHPDLNNDDESKVNSFKLISEAYEVLTNPKNNRCYTLKVDPGTLSDQSPDDRSYWDWWMEQFGGFF